MERGSLAVGGRLTLGKGRDSLRTSSNPRLTRLNDLKTQRTSEANLNMSALFELHSPHFPQKTELKRCGS